MVYTASIWLSFQLFVLYFIDNYLIGLLDFIVFFLIKYIFINFIKPFIKSFLLFL